MRSVRTHKGFRFRAYPTPGQKARLIAWEQALRWLWNLAHEQRLMGLARCGDEVRRTSYFGQNRELTELRAVAPWLADAPRNVCSQILVELDQAWQRCFRGIARRPRWKIRGAFVGLCEPHPKVWRLDGNTLRFPKLGNLRVVAHRPLEGKPKSCTLKRDAAGDWFVSIVCEIEIADPAARREPVVAIDRGIVNLGATSDGDMIANHRHLEASLKRLARAQRTVSRRKKGSKNREKAKCRVARIHRKVARQREHHLHVLSARLAKSHGVVVLEKLNVAGMIRGNCSRSIADAGWSRFADMLRYKLAWSGGTLIEVPAHYSSQECSACGAIDAKSRRSQAVYCCTSCGHAEHADVNAAKVLKRRANRSVLLGEGTVPEAARRTKKRLNVPRRSTEKLTLTAQQITLSRDSL